jgi:hypothetical protein
MQTNQRSTFTTIRVEGSILPPDLLQRIAEGDPDLGGLTPAFYNLLEGEKLNEAINRSWNRLPSAWASFQGARAKALTPNDFGTKITRDRFLLPLFQELGYGRLLGAKTLEIDGKSYPISHIWQHTPIHLVGCGVDLDKRTPGVAGAARSSPHSLVQELLNRSDKHLWAFVSNGLRLRILRNSVSLTRQAYVEFDLEAMMNGEVYADFVLLWLLCHQSRVEADKPEECWLEKWSRTAQEQGTRALDQLRKGVEEAIAALGQGFLSHPANRELRQKLQSGTLSTQDYYRQLLRLVYRLLFLFVAEDRELLFNPKADVAAKERYTQYYSTARLRHLAERRCGTRHADLFYGLRLVMEKLGSEAGCSELGLPALGSFLWSTQAISDLEACQIANGDLLAGVRALAFITTRHGRRPVDYKNLNSKELGSVYESLLELHPELNASAGTFKLKTAIGNERKTTGSYYTPESLVQCLLDSALDPVLDEAVKQPDPEAAILNLKVCDPACGSGHFLIAAAHRIAKRLAAVRTGDEEPAPKAIRTALRDAIGHCIYGVDVNPMAVELCKVALWMEALEPGKPLSFLDHHIQCGNSLLGATPALLRKGIPDEAFNPIEGDDKAVCSKYKRQNREQRKGQLSLFAPNLQPWERLRDLATGMLNLDAIADDSISGVRQKQEKYESLVKSSPYLFNHFLADTWCAAFVWKKQTSDELPYPITEEVFRQIERSPYNVPDWLHREVERLANQYNFFHWHLVFPDVFQILADGEEPENERAGWCGGFDVVLGNPPWERIKLEEKQWFATPRPDIASAPNAATRRRMIAALKTEDPALYAAFLDDRRQAEGESHFVRDSGRYPLCGRGDVNTYAIFAETNRLILGGTGRVGCIVPSGIAIDDTTKFFFQDLMESKSLASLYDFENREAIFPSVHRSYKFCLLTITGLSSPSSKGADFVFFAHQTKDMQEKERHFTLTAKDLALLNPNTRTCPIFRFNRDAEITKAIYRRVPVLIKEGQPGENSWSIHFFRMFDMANDSELFRTYEQLESAGWKLEGNRFFKDEQTYLPLYEAKMFHQFDHRWATYEGLETREVTPAEKKNSDCVVLPRYWIDTNEVKSKVSQWNHDWILGFRKTARSTDIRTLIVSPMKIAGVGDKAPLLLLSIDVPFLPALIVNLNSFVTDFVVRNKVGSTDLTNFYVKQFPILPPFHYTNSDLAFITPRALELTYTAWDLEPFAKDCGYNGAPFRWDEERRFLLRCELDAAYFHLYGIERDDVDYIMETFPIVKRKDEQKYGEYRTKRVILEIYDAMTEAISTGNPYQTLLDPPPADPAVAHPPGEAIE